MQEKALSLELIADAGEAAKGLSELHFDSRPAGIVFLGPAADSAAVE